MNASEKILMWVAEMRNAIDDKNISDAKKKTAERKFYQRKYYLAHKEQKDERSRQWYEDNKDSYNAKRRERRRVNRNISDEK